MNYVEKNKNILYNLSVIILKIGVVLYGVNFSKEIRRGICCSRG